VKANAARKKRPTVPNPAGKAGSPVSLYPLSFEEAVAGLAQVKMPEKEKPKAKPAKGK
jgi:hypothetical protein